MCDALHETDTGDGVIFLTDRSGAALYRSAALMSHKHDNCEVISGIRRKNLPTTRSDVSAARNVEQR